LRGDRLQAFREFNPDLQRESMSGNTPIIDLAERNAHDLMKVALVK
jgi:hypothetical protein